MIRYVVLVLWMTSHLAIVGRVAMRRVALWYRDGVWCLWMPCW